MASIRIISTFGWGADKLLITEGDGLGVVPEVVSAVATSRNTVTVTFDRAMTFHVTESKVLDLDSYHIEDVLFGRQLFVLRVERISDTEVNLITQDQEPIEYEVTVTKAQDQFGNPIGAVNNTANFTGIDPAGEYPLAAKVYSFWGMYAGMESSEETNITPDIDPPYLTDQSPAPGWVEQPKDKIILFHLKDDVMGVSLALTRVYVEGVLAYDGPTGTFVAPYNGAGSFVTGTPADYAFGIQKTTDWPSYALITVRVVSGDLTPIPNWLDETYSFTSEDYAAPILTDNFPTGIDVPKTTNISFTLRDVGGSGVDPFTINCTISGVPAITNGVFIAPYNGVGSSITPNAGVNGYDVVIDPTLDFNSYQNVVVNVNFKDNEETPGAGGWTFKIEDYLGPQIIPVYPINGQLGVEVTTNIQLRLADEKGILSGSTIVEVDINGGGFQEAYRQGVGFSPGWDGPGSGVVENPSLLIITIDPVSIFPYGANVTVRVTSEDLDGNPERL